MNIMFSSTPVPMAVVVINDMAGLVPYAMVIVGLVALAVLVVKQVRSSSAMVELSSDEFVSDSWSQVNPVAKAAADRAFGNAVREMSEAMDRDWATNPRNPKYGKVDHGYDICQAVGGCDQHLYGNRNR